MDERSLGEPPFGRLRLPPSVEHIQAVANKIEDRHLTRRLVSIARWRRLSERSDPIDTLVCNGGRARPGPASRVLPGAIDANAILDLGAQGHAPAAQANHGNK